MLTLLVRVINVILALALVLIAIAVYWFAFRPLPKVSGEMTAPIGARAVIQRDARGVPHIQAGSWQDAVFLQGFATAQDRLWQMDSLRRFAAGELAEVFGPGALAVDQRARRMRMRAMAEVNAGRLSAEDREAFAEYARGVNYYIDTHRGRYSLEFSLPGHAYDPRPWTITDSMLIGLVMFRDLTDNSEYEFFKGLLLNEAQPAKVNLLYPSPEGQALSPGSNSWAVSGAHSASGAAMLANDMHLSYGVPSTWHLVHLKAPGLEVAGTGLPGVPFVITGHNADIAWGVTNLGSDVMDLYSEQIDLRSGRYLFGGHTEQAQLDRQVIGVRGTKPVTVDVWITRHGPIVINEKGQTLSMRWSAADGFGFPFGTLARAKNWTEFRQAVGQFWGPAQNFVYADRTGNIGYQAGGRIPIRGGEGKSSEPTDRPVSGSSGQSEWSGYLPFEQMPNVYNPASGIIATANQNPFPPDFPITVPGRYDDAYRVNQIRARLGAKSNLSIEDMAAIQKDVYSAYDLFLARRLVQAASQGKASASVQEAVAVLKSWHGQMDKDQAAPVITELFSNRMRAELVRVAGAKSTAIFLPRSHAVEQLLRECPGGWVAKDDWNGFILSNLEQALAEGRRKQGSPIANWKWGQTLQWNFEHPVGKQLPLVSGFFNIGPVPMSGSGTTVKQTTRTLGPSERLVVDFGDLNRSTLEIPVGESGMVASGNYKDQWSSYYVGKSFPLGWNKVEAADTLSVRPR